MSAIINIHGCDGSFWPVHGGPNEGSEGVALGQDQVKGIYEAPVRTEWAGTARGDGGMLKGKWNEWRDMALGFHVAAARGRGSSQATIESRFRRAFDYREDQWDHDSHLAMVEFITEESGTRWLDVQLYEQPDFDPGIDSLVVGHGNPIMPLRAGQPMWYQPDVVTQWSTSGSSGSGEIVVSNPTDQPMKQKWIITRGNWTLPDVSWEGPPGARRRGVDKLRGRDDRNRMILMPPIGAIQGGATVDLDTDNELMVRDAHNTNLLGQMPVPGRFFMYVIPPYTQEQKLPVSVTSAPAGGAMVKLVQPRRWSTPRGMELT